MTKESSDYGMDVLTPSEATLEPDGDDSLAAASPAAVATGEACAKCGAALGENERVQICRSCGWYASLGTFVDVDPAWDAAMGDAPAEEEEKTQTQAALEHLQVWKDLLPRWAWMLIGLHLALLVGSVLVRLMVPEGLPRTLWACAQLVVGFGIFGACHLVVYIATISQDADYGVLDLVLKPVKLWMPTLRGLPRKLPLTSAGTGGLAAVLWTILIIGSVPYSLLWSWKVKERPKPNLVNAIIQQAQKVEGEEKPLEDAIEDFTGRVGNVQDLDRKDPWKKAAPEERTNVDCVIIGYTTADSDPNEITSLVLAHEHQGQLVVVGRVTGGFENEVRYKFAEKFRKISRPSSFVRTNFSAMWISPEYACRVNCGRITSSGRLTDMQYMKMLGRFRVK